MLIQGPERSVIVRRKICCHEHLLSKVFERSTPILCTTYISTSGIHRCKNNGAAFVWIELPHLLSSLPPFKLINFKLIDIIHYLFLLVTYNYLFFCFVLLYGRKMMKGYFHF